MMNGWKTFYQRERERAFKRLPSVWDRGRTTSCGWRGKLHYCNLITWLCTSRLQPTSNWLAALDHMTITPLICSVWYQDLAATPWIGWFVTFRELNNKATTLNVTVFKEQALALSFSGFLTNLDAQNRWADRFFLNCKSDMFLFCSLSAKLLLACSVHGGTYVEGLSIAFKALLHIKKNTYLR